MRRERLIDAFAGWFGRRAFGLLAVVVFFIVVGDLARLVAS